MSVPEKKKPGPRQRRSEFRKRNPSLSTLNVAALEALLQSEPFGNQTIPTRGSKKADLIEMAMGCLGPTGLPCPERIKATRLKMAV